MHPWFTLRFAAISTFAWLSLATTPSATLPTTPEDELLRNATLVFKRLVEAPAAAIPASILRRARGIVVIPAVVRDGASNEGLGVLSAQIAGPAAWTPPAVIRFQGNIPLNLETNRLDFVIVALRARALDLLTQPQFISPVTQAIAAGPLGEETRVSLNADLLAYIHFDTYVAGITVEDWMIGEVKESNAKLYGHEYSTDDIIRGAGFFRLPPAARLWRSALAGYFGES